MSEEFRAEHGRTGSAQCARLELQETTWHVVHPYSSAEFPGVVRPCFSPTFLSLSRDCLITYRDQAG